MVYMSFILHELSPFILFLEMLPHLAENLTNLFQIYCKTKVILSPCILEITSFYPNYFAKQPGKALCSEFLSLFKKYTELYVSNSIHLSQFNDFEGHYLDCLRRRNPKLRNALIQCRQLKHIFWKTHASLKSSISAPAWLPRTSTFLCLEDPKHSLTAISLYVSLSLPTHAWRSLVVPMGGRQPARTGLSVLPFVHLFTEQKFSTSQTSSRLVVSGHFC